MRSGQINITVDERKLDLETASSEVVVGIGLSLTDFSLCEVVFPQSRCLSFSTKSLYCWSLSPQEQEDLALAQALAASEEEYRRQQQRQQGRESKQSNCSLS